MLQQCCDGWRFLVSCSDRFSPPKLRCPYSFCCDDRTFRFSMVNSRFFSSMLLINCARRCSTLYNSFSNSSISFDRLVVVRLFNVGGTDRRSVVGSMYIKTRNDLRPVLSSLSRRDDTIYTLNCGVILSTL